MSPSVTRPASIVTKTVNGNLRKGMSMPGNDGPCCCKVPSGEKVGNGVKKDVFLQSSRTVFAEGFSDSAPTKQTITNA